MLPENSHITGPEQRRIMTTTASDIGIFSGKEKMRLELSTDESDPTHKFAIALFDGKAPPDQQFKTWVYIKSPNGPQQADISSLVKRLGLAGFKGGEAEIRKLAGEGEGKLDDKIQEIIGAYEKDVKAVKALFKGIEQINLSPLNDEEKAKEIMNLFKTSELDKQDSEFHKLFNRFITANYMSLAENNLPPFDKQLAKFKAKLSKLDKNFAPKAEIPREKVTENTKLWVSDTENLLINCPASNEGVRAVRLKIGRENDKENRYAIKTDGYIYHQKPKVFDSNKFVPYSRDGKRWVLLNIDSVHYRTGLSKYNIKATANLIDEDAFTKSKDNIAKNLDWNNPKAVLKKAQDLGYKGKSEGAASYLINTVDILNTHNNSGISAKRSVETSPRTKGNTQLEPKVRNNDKADLSKIDKNFEPNIEPLPYSDIDAFLYSDVETLPYSAPDIEPVSELETESLQAGFEVEENKFLPNVEPKSEPEPVSKPVSEPGKDKNIPLQEHSEPIGTIDQSRNALLYHLVHELNILKKDLKDNPGITGTKDKIAEHEELINLLIGVGADPTIKNNDGIILEDVMQDRDVEPGPQLEDNALLWFDIKPFQDDISQEEVESPDDGKIVETEKTVSEDKSNLNTKFLEEARKYGFVGNTAEGAKAYMQIYEAILNVEVKRFHGRNLPFKRHHGTFDSIMKEFKGLDGEDLLKVFAADDLLSNNPRLREQFIMERGDEAVRLAFDRNDLVLMKLLDYGAKFNL